MSRNASIQFWFIVFCPFAPQSPQSPVKVSCLTSFACICHVIWETVLNNLILSGYKYFVSRTFVCLQNSKKCWLIFHIL